jgi:hypothetical protein|tara:strand:- start:2429 stop:2839 length:411 start_codon:yes stop_codon:yes gene_type:complete
MNLANDKFNKFNQIIDLDLVENINDLIDKDYIINFFRNYFTYDWNMTNTFLEYYELNKEKNDDLTLDNILDDIDKDEDEEFYKTFINKYLKIQYDIFDVKNEELQPQIDLDLTNLNINLKNEEIQNKNFSFDIFIK